VNSRRLNVFTAGVIAVLVMLSVVLTASVLFPEIGDRQILGVLIGGSVLAAALALGVKAYERLQKTPAPMVVRYAPELRDEWRMSPLDTLPPARLTLLSRVWMLVLRGYLVIAAGLLLVKLVQLALASG
jgi:hypothetical protein